ANPSDTSDGLANAIKSKLLYVTTSKFEGDWHSTMHNHYFSELFYITAGKGKFLVGNDSFEVHPDDLVIINPHIDHTETSLDSSPLEYIVLGVEGLSFTSGEKPSVADNGTGNNDCGYSVASFMRNNTEMRTFLNTLVNEMQIDNEYKTTLCQNLLCIIMISILRHKKLNVSLVATKKVSRECALVKDYIDKNFKNSISLDDLATFSHLNKYYLVHNFSKSYGLSPINYLLEKRINESKFLLDSTSYSLSQISQIVGFSSSSYFSQSFKRAMGISPMEFRKRTTNK
ncbi:MAG: AraC family transcriptional regulator, partial [Oscillospiraceae bacterium]